MFNNKQKSDKLKSYLVAALFLGVAVIGIWLAFFNSGTDANKTKQQQPERTYQTDTTRQSNISQQFKLDSVAFSNYTRRSSENSGSIVKTILITILFIVFITIGLMIFKRKFNTSKGFGLDMEILGKKYFGQKQFLMMVRVENKKLLIGVTENSVNLVKDFGEIEESERNQSNPERQEKSPGNFAGIIKQISFNQDE